MILRRDGLLLEAAESRPNIYKYSDKYIYTFIYFILLSIGEPAAPTSLIAISAGFYVLSQNLIVSKLSSSPEPLVKLPYMLVYQDYLYL